MALPDLQVSITSLTAANGSRITRLDVRGRGGVGSEGNAQGHQVREVLTKIVADPSVDGLIVDLRNLQYTFGDWIGSCCLHRRLRECPTCVVASGDTWQHLDNLWKSTHLTALIPLFQSIGDAAEYFRLTPGALNDPAA